MLSARKLRRCPTSYRGKAAIKRELARSLLDDVARSLLDKRAGFA